MSIFRSEKAQSFAEVKSSKDDIIKEIKDSEVLLDSKITLGYNDRYDLKIVKPAYVLAKKKVGQYESDIPKTYQQIFYVKIFESKRECHEWKIPAEVEIQLQNKWISDYIVSSSAFAVIHRIKNHHLINATML